MNNPLRIAITIGVLLLGAAERSALALPTMIRLGYVNCAACHIAPQGGAGRTASFRQTASYAQLFWAAREWRSPPSSSNGSASTARIAKGWTP